MKLRGLTNASGKKLMINATNIITVQNPNRHNSTSKCLIYMVGYSEPIGVKETYDRVKELLA